MTELEKILIGVLVATYLPSAIKQTINFLLMIYRFIKFPFYSKKRENGIVMDFIEITPYEEYKTRWMRYVVDGFYIPSEKELRK